MKKIKKILSCILWTLLFIVIFPATIIHSAYQVWYYRNVVIPKCILSGKNGDEKTDDGYDNRDNTDTESE